MSMNLLPSDLEEEILCRDPFRRLAKFRSVCKLWNSMILDERVILKNMSYSGEHGFIITHNAILSSSVSIKEQQNVVDSPPSLVTKNLSLRKFRPAQSVKVYKIVQCDGLLLCVMDNQLLVRNPLLKETSWVKCGSDFHAYDDAYSLGYLSPCDYRILRFRCASNSRNRPPRVEVCQLASKTWKVIDYPISCTFDWVLKIPLSILSLRGTPYWIGFREEDHTTTAFVQSFDFAKERFQPIDQLPFRYEELNPIAMEIFKGDRLSVLEQCHKTRKICIWVKHWLLPSWSRLMVVAIPHFPLLHPPSSRVSTDFFLDKNGRLVVICVEFNVSDMYNIYRVMGENNDELQVFETDNAAENSISCSCSFVPSLVRLPGFLKQDTSRIRWKKNRFN
ncbi:PREDICTED: putative F-box/LRR-repeat/kelch-repeat protein At1g11620 [Camelina sativa]|uniref:F-box/LRR-repeat/kelch-repeat protein At1g11620 n=1 Tax=Camelina sativa TaxID=90675 RepID=A0ABM0SL01_CAMSA|nr:PREDICTED: putative F-box/LRR-repeat/kelch-repeat protein At1g11620 [Camelina sativa]